MRRELKRIEPLRAANVAALVYGLVMAAFALIFLPFVLLAVVFAPTQEGKAGVLFFPLLLIVYPIMGLLMGWIAGLITSAVYNLVARWVGGLLVELSEPPQPGVSATADPIR